MSGCCRGRSCRRSTISSPRSSGLERRRPFSATSQTGPSPWSTGSRTTSPCRRDRPEISRPQPGAGRCGRDCGRRAHSRRRDCDAGSQAFRRREDRRFAAVAAARWHGTSCGSALNRKRNGGFERIGSVRLKIVDCRILSTTSSIAPLQSNNILPLIHRPQSSLRIAAPNPWASRAGAGGCRAVDAN